MIIRTLYVDRTVVDLPRTAAISRRLSLPPVVVDGPREIYRRLAESADPVGSAKQALYLTVNRGAFVRDCPGTRDYTCCGYRILHIGTFCTMDCAYCILQAYYHPPLLQFFVNHDDLFAELDRLFEAPDTVRIGTGEFTDSLIWERCTDLNRRLIDRFAAQRRAVLELKTKTTAVDRLAGIDHRQKTILAWSLNSQAVIADEERGTATLEARLTAARRCAGWGYPLAFHFDPMVIYEGCEADYRRVVARLFERVPPGRIVWISLGTFRFMPALKPIVEHRFPASRIVYGESVPGLDGKLRYFKPLRMALYRRMVGWIRQAAPEVTIYLCMEDDEVWQHALGFTPRDRDGLPRMLDRSAERLCGIRADGGRH